MAMPGADGTVSTAANYRRFATQEAAGRSPSYEALALGVAGDEQVLSFLNRLPAGKRQPNLLFAAVRHLLGDVPHIEDLRSLVIRRDDELASVMTERRTQTNEPGRCATLLPALARIEGPLAIIEVGASAGLCLNLAQYSYDYGSVQLRGADPEAPVLRCTVRGGEPTLTMPDVVWAAGLDLNPLDPSSSEDRSWLRCLVWPDQPERAARLAGALDAAVRTPVEVHEGDLLEQLPALLDQVPDGVTPVVFHSAVLVYVDEQMRARFAGLLRQRGVTWVANESPGVVVDVKPPNLDTSPFVLSVDGEPVAWTHPHGDWIDWTG
jgi:hypothetical protein